jgi:hypothetical protein
MRSASSARVRSAAVPKLDYERKRRRGRRPKLEGLRYTIGVGGLAITALGLAWLYTYTFTDYRAHLRPLLIPLGILAVAIGLPLLVWSFVRSLWPE